MTYWASIENCQKVVGLKQVISGEDHKPYAVKTNLGWSIDPFRADVTITSQH